MSPLTQGLNYRSACDIIYCYYVGLHSQATVMTQRNSATERQSRHVNFAQAYHPQLLACWQPILSEGRMEIVTLRRLRYMFA